MKYLVGKNLYLIFGDFRTRYYDCLCLAADSEEEAIEQYISKYPDYSFTVRCIGTVDDANTLHISDFSKKYESGNMLVKSNSGQHFHIITKFIETPPFRTAHNIFGTSFVRSASMDTVMKLYDPETQNERYPFHYIGYIDDNDTLIIPDILKYCVE